MYLEGMTWNQAKELFSAETIALLPLGSVEQHGPICPLGTDFIIPQELAKKVETLCPEKLVVLPTLPYGVCPYHDGFPGTIDIGWELLSGVTKKIAGALIKYGVRKFVFLNGHGGNGPALDDTALWIYRQGGMAAIIDWWSLASQLNPEWMGGHGTGQETSMMMAIRPGWVNKDDFFESKITNLTARLPNTYINTVTFGKGTVRILRNVEDVSSNGAFGEDDPREATSRLGEEIIEGVVPYLRDFIEVFKEVLLP